MPRGQPDFGQYSSETYVAGLSDMAELAVRLGSIVIFDRRGKVIDVDDFEGVVLKWTPVTIGNGAVVFDSTYPKSGSQGLKLTSGDGANQHGTIQKGFTPLFSQRLGLEFVFSSPSADTYFVLQISYFDGTLSHLAGIRFDFNAQKIAYQSTFFAYTDIIDTEAFYTSNFFYFPVKLVVDFATGYFVRLLFGGVEHDLSSYPIFSQADATNPNIKYTIAHRYRAAAGSDIYIDDVILTEDEP